jgi:hypothetical protein
MHVFSHDFLITIAVSTAALATSSGVSAATTRSWPGAAPCDTSLQACVNASANGDTVQVQTNGPIAEDLQISKPLNLLARPGYRPVFAAGNGLTVGYSPGSGVAWNTSIDGFTLLDGSVAVRGGSGDLTVTLRNLDVSHAAYASGAALEVSYSGTGSVHYVIERNRVRLNATSQVQGIVVSAGTGGTFSGSVHDNRIEGNSAGGPSDVGLEIYGTAATAPSALIYSNQVSGNLYVGCLVYVAGASSVLLADNLFRMRNPGPGTFGIQLAQSAGAGNSLDAQVFNNTIVGWSYGVFGNGASVGGRLYNNLYAYNTSQAIAQQDSTMTEKFSLFFANGGPAPTLGTGSMIADPKFARGLEDVHLTAGSPAVDAADSADLGVLLANASIGQIDADGLRRFKGALADIGAFEYGDGALIEFAKTNDSTIDNPLLNGNSAALPQLTQNKTPDTYIAAVYDPGLTSLSYFAGHFGVVDEDGTLPPAGSAFNVFAPALGGGALLHTTSGSNVSAAPALTRIDDPYLDGRDAAIVLVTPRVTPYFNHPFGVAYGFLFATNWFISQLDAGASAFPTGVQFDVYAQDPSLDAFVWNAPFAGPSTAIDHVLLNGEPCARLYVTNGTSDPHPTAVTYAAQRWMIVNLDGGNMPVGAEFYVVIDEAATQFCRYDHLFHNGFD